ISALELDPTVTPTAADGTDAVLVAGTGDLSNFVELGGPTIGLYRTTNGGNTWTQIGAAELTGLTIVGIAPRGNVIVVAARDGSGGARGGIYRSTDTGATFQPISGNPLVYGLPAGDGFDVAGDPGNVNRIYTALAGGGVF